jgi:hypothetical protein
MYGGIASKIAMLAKKGSEEADVTPDSVNWTDGSAFASFSSTASGAQTITGINQTIELYYSCNYCGDGGTIKYKKNGGSWTSISYLGTIEIADGDTLDWGYESYFGYIDIAIKNASDGDAVIDSSITFYNEFFP